MPIDATDHLNLRGIGILRTEIIEESLDHALFPAFRKLHKSTLDERDLENSTMSRKK